MPRITPFQSVEEFCLHYESEIVSEIMYLKNNVMSRDYQTKNTSHSITCATVHQFHGSEKDVILYDAVDCYKMKYPGMCTSPLKTDIEKKNLLW